MPLGEACVTRNSPARPALIAVATLALLLVACAGGSDSTQPSQPPSHSSTTAIRDGSPEEVAQTLYEAHVNAG